MTPTPTTPKPTAAGTASRWPTLRVLLTSHAPFVALLWVLFTVVLLVITGIVAVSGGITQSVVHHGTTQVPRWLLFGLGIDAVSTYLRLHLAHGRTRREFTAQVVAHAVVVAGLAALLITLGYLLERGVYAMFDWPQTLSHTGMFTSADQYPAIFGTFWLVLVLWTVAGMVVGLGFFRSPGVGIATIPVGLVIVLPGIVAVGANGLPVFGERLAGLELTTPALLGAGAALLAAGVGVVWALVRDVPLKVRTP